MKNIQKLVQYSFLDKDSKEKLISLINDKSSGNIVDINSKLMNYYTSLTTSEASSFIARENFLPHPMKWELILKAKKMLIDVYQNNMFSNDIETANKEKETLKNKFVNMNNLKIHPFSFYVNESLSEEYGFLKHSENVFCAQDSKSNYNLYIFENDGELSKGNIKNILLLESFLLFSGLMNRFKNIKDIKIFSINNKTLEANEYEINEVEIKRYLDISSKYWYMIENNKEPEALINLTKEVSTWTTNKNNPDSSNRLINLKNKISELSDNFVAWRIFAKYSEKISADYSKQINEILSADYMPDFNYSKFDIDLSKIKINYFYNNKKIIKKLEEVLVAKKITKEEINKILNSESIKKAKEFDIQKLKSILMEKFNVDLNSEIFASALIKDEVLQTKPMLDLLEHYSPNFIHKELYLKDPEFSLELIKEPASGELFELKEKTLSELDSKTREVILDVSKKYLTERKKMQETFEEDGDILKNENQKKNKK